MKGAPVRHAIYVGIFHHNDRLTLPGNALRKKRIEVIDRGQVRRHNRILAITNCVIHTWMTHRARHEIIHRYNTNESWRERSRNLRIAHISEVGYAVHIQIMNLGFKRISRTWPAVPEKSIDLG